MKNNFKKVISTFLATSMLLSTMSTAFASDSLGSISAGSSVVPKGTTTNSTYTGNYNKFAPVEMGGYQVSIYYAQQKGTDSAGDPVYVWDEPEKVIPVAELQLRMDS